ncbi:hypothetical protein I304_06582 [Cryptococcus deuterogattii CBS 10090]|nr:hypothetical protein I304_06582 [Cryptococcus deuterogattii CBS 10090]
MRASTLAQFTSDSPLTLLSTSSNSNPLLSPLPSPVRALPEHPRSPFDNPTTNGGHSKNKDRPYPLFLIPFDLSEPYKVSEYLTIRSYDETCQFDYLGQSWANEYRYGLITDEQTFDDRVFRRYLDRFIEENHNYITIATKFYHQANLKAIFYGGKDKGWAKLDLVDEYRRQTRKVLGVPSQSQSTSRSRKDGATTPDVSLIGYVKDSGCSLGWKPVLYAVVELKWTKLATHLAGEDKRKSDEKTLEYLCQEGVFQTMWYVILGYAISGCIFGLSVVNEYFYRIVYLYQDSASSTPVLALEADSEFLEKAGCHFEYQRNGYSVEELAELPDFWRSPPNRLISDRASAFLNKEARYHLDATILLFLARVATHPTQRFLNGPPPLLDSVFDTSSNSNKETRVLDHLSAVPHPKINKSDTVDIDLDDIDSESGELTLAAYKGRLEMLGVRVKLVTREDMDVLLARGINEQLWLLNECTGMG